MGNFGLGLMCEDRSNIGEMNKFGRNKRSRDNPCWQCLSTTKAQWACTSSHPQNILVYTQIYGKLE